MSINPFGPLDPRLIAAALATVPPAAQQAAAALGDLAAAVDRAAVQMNLLRNELKQARLQRTLP